jgi:hypothetical protein
MTEETKTKGPASYFPSIEKKYERPITYWLDLLKTVKDKKHMEWVMAMPTRWSPITWPTLKPANQASKSSPR